LSDDLDAAPDSYVIRLHGATIASGTLRLGEVLVLIGDGQAPDVPGDEVKEAAFGTRAVWCHESFANELRRQGFEPIDIASVLLTHAAEIIRGQLAALLSYKSLRTLLERQDPAYKKLLDDIIPAHISYTGMQGVLKALLQERVSIRSLPTIIEAVAEVAPFMRKIDGIAEHVRGRLSQQLCADVSSQGVLKLVRISARWDAAIQVALKRDARGDIVEFDMEPKDIEQFGNELSTHVRRLIDSGQDFCLVSSSAARPYVRMMVERLFPSVSVLAHSELARGIPMQTIGSIG
jgi:flagellar biosynthesis protein FlhA